MARSHRIGQTKTVQVFRLVTRNSYEQELVHSANRKLGLERAMDAGRSTSDAGGAGAGGSGAGGTGATAAGAEAGTNGAVSSSAPRDRGEIERMLRCGAQDISVDDDSAFRQFSEVRHASTRPRV